MRSTGKKVGTESPHLMGIFWALKSESAGQDLHWSKPEDIRLKSASKRGNSSLLITGETVEKGEFGSVGPPHAPLFYSVLLGEVSFNSAERLSSFLTEFYGQCLILADSLPPR